MRRRGLILGAAAAPPAAFEQIDATSVIAGGGRANVITDIRFLQTGKTAVDDAAMARARHRASAGEFRGMLDKAGYAGERRLVPGPARHPGPSIVFCNASTL